KRAVEGLGRRGGLLYVTAIFASLHIFFLNGVDLVFVFAVGLFYGVVVLVTRNLWGVILSHSLGNVILYLVAPFLFPLVRSCGHRRGRFERVIRSRARDGSAGRVFTKSGRCDSADGWLVRPSTR